LNIKHINTAQGNNAITRITERATVSALTTKYCSGMSAGENIATNNHKPI